MNIDINTKNIFIKNTKYKGKSIFAKKNFEKGEPVFIICGPIVIKPSIYTVPIDFDLYIDPLSIAGKELNHSCELSCGIKNRNIVVAMKNIKKGEEINIDYAMIVSKYNQRLLKQDIKCKCKTKNCRGEFGSYEKLPNKLKKKYKGFISEYLVRRKRC
jgi:hypothetical protein